MYHYTSPEVVPYLFEVGLRMSMHGPGGGGVYLSTRGPASYGLGTPHYEENLIKVVLNIKTSIYQKFAIRCNLRILPRTSLGARSWF
jgi:hypothetical protein